MNALRSVHTVVKDCGQQGVVVVLGQFNGLAPTVVGK